MIHVDYNGIRERRNEIRARVMTEHRIGADRSVRPVMILVRERTGRRKTENDDKKAHAIWLERWIVTYNTGETRTYERLEP